MLSLFWVGTTDSAQVKVTSNLARCDSVTFIMTIQSCKYHEAETLYVLIG